MKKLFLAVLFLCLATPSFAALPKWGADVALLGKIDSTLPGSRWIDQIVPEGEFALTVPVNKAFHLKGSVLYPVEVPSKLQWEDGTVRLGVGMHFGAK